MSSGGGFSYPGSTRGSSMVSKVTSPRMGGRGPMENILFNPFVKLLRAKRILIKKVKVEDEGNKKRVKRPLTREEELERGLAALQNVLTYFRPTSAYSKPSIERYSSSLDKLKPVELVQKIETPMECLQRCKSVHEFLDFLKDKPYQANFDFLKQYTQKTSPTDLLELLGVGQQIEANPEVYVKGLWNSGQWRVMRIYKFDCCNFSISTKEHVAPLWIDIQIIDLKGLARRLGRQDIQVVCYGSYRHEKTNKANYDWIFDGLSFQIVPPGKDKIFKWHQIHFAAYANESLEIKVRYSFGDRPSNNGLTIKSRPQSSRGLSFSKNNLPSQTGDILGAPEHQRKKSHDVEMNKDRGDFVPDSALQKRISEIHHKRMAKILQKSQGGRNIIKMNADQGNFEAEAIQQQIEERQQKKAMRIQSARVKYQEELHKTKGRRELSMYRHDVYLLKKMYEDHLLLTKEQKRIHDTLLANIILVSLVFEQLWAHFTLAIQAHGRIRRIFLYLLSFRYGYRLLRKRAGKTQFERMLTEARIFISPIVNLTQVKSRKRAGKVVAHFVKGQIRCMSLIRVFLKFHATVVRMQGLWKLYKARKSAFMNLLVSLWDKNFLNVYYDQEDYTTTTNTGGQTTFLTSMEAAPATKAKEKVFMPTQPNSGFSPAVPNQRKVEKGQRIRETSNRLPTNLNIQPVPVKDVIVNREAVAKEKLRSRRKTIAIDMIINDL